MEGKARQAYLEEALGLAVDAWQDPPFTLAVEQATAAAGEGQEGFGGNAQASPGLMVQFAIWSLIMSGSTLVVERTSGAMQRLPIDQPLATGVRSIDAFATVGKGQRLGLFAGTGVGKSVLLGMMARHTGADVIVIGLVGERGREVNEFLERDLGRAGLARSVVVVATSSCTPFSALRRSYRPAAP